MKIIKFDTEKKYVNDFLSLPKKIYTKKNNTEDSDTVKQLITNTHPLNKYFKLTKFIVDVISGSLYPLISETPA